MDRMEDDPEQLGQMQSFAQQEQLLRFLELQFASVPACIYAGLRQTFLESLVHVSPEEIASQLLILKTVSAHVWISKMLRMEVQIVDEVLRLMK